MASANIIKITPTIYGSMLSTAKQLGIKHKVLNKSTLNEKHGILETETPDENDIASIGCFAIGRGGMRLISGLKGERITAPTPHNPDHAALYEQIPFVLREIDNDLTASERVNYALRKKMNIGGKDYFAYYLRRINKTGVELSAEKVTVKDGVSTTVPFEPSSSNLNPTPPNIPNDGVIPTSGISLTTSGVIKLELNQSETKEVLEVCRILYGDVMYATITEIGLISGVDRNVNVEDGGSGSINFKEYVASQVAVHITTNCPLAYSNNGFDQEVDLGSSEALLI